MEWIIARWVTFTATVLIAGACVVGLLLVPRIGEGEDVRHAIAGEVARLGIGATLALIPASFLRLADQVMALRSPGDPVWQGVDVLLTSTTWGMGFLWQFGATLLSVAGFLVARRTPRRMAAWLPASVAALGLCATPALQGHAIGSEEATLVAVIADVAHVCGASLWLGAIGVIGWLGVTIPNADGIVSPERAALARARLRALVPLVPPVALPGAALLIASGVVASVLHLRTVSDLWSAEWGRYVLAKSVIVSVIVGLGALNWRRLGPRLAVDDDVSAMRRSLIAELLLALLVLMITAVLVVTPLPGE